MERQAVLIRRLQVRFLPGQVIKKERSDNMTLAEKMVRYRAIKRISQEELARRCGVSLQTINSIENEIQTPSRVTRTKILLVVDEEEKDGE